MKRSRYYINYLIVHIIGCILTVIATAYVPFMFGFSTIGLSDGEGLFIYGIVLLLFGYFFNLMGKLHIALMIYIESHIED